MLYLYPNCEAGFPLLVSSVKPLQKLVGCKELKTQTNVDTAEFSIARSAHNFTVAIKSLYLLAFIYILLSLDTFANCSLK